MNTVGLTEQEAKLLLEKNGPNEIVEKRASGLERMLRLVASPASLMLVVASVLSFAIGRQFDGYFILVLFALNVGMSFWHERKADNALEELKAKLTVDAHVLRDGVWRDIPSRELVLGDIVECGIGSLVPADLKIGEANNLSINEAVLTGESLPKEKNAGDEAYSGSVVTTGLLRGEVTATGNSAFFGRIATAAGERKRQSSMETDILSISRFLIGASLIAIAILTFVLLREHQSLTETLLLDLSLLIAGIPISLPTIMTLIVSIGAMELARKKALVRRLASLEDLANVTLLLTDKTGTLTRNEIVVEDFCTYGTRDKKDLAAFAGAAASPFGRDLIDRAISLYAKQNGKESGAALDAKVDAYTPADSIRKRTTTLLSYGGSRYLVSMGTPPVIASFAHLGEADNAAFADDVKRAAEGGSRAVALAIKKDPVGLDDETDMEIAGLFILSDPLRDDAKETIAYLKSEGVNVIMITGDMHETAARVGASLGMEGAVLRAKEADIGKLSPAMLANTSVFAEVLPDDKLALVKRAQEGFTVAMAGDGVNDLPAVRRADVGMAVANAVDALKGTADIVFLAPGIAEMRTALNEARTIFYRLYNYSLYRISESFRLIVTALILGIIIKGFPLTAVEIILLAFLNDIPIITLAFDRVKRTDRPADLNPRERFIQSTLYGLVGVANSVILYFILARYLHLPLEIVQTAFFLKLTVGGHMLIYVAHTKERWWRFLPAKSVIIATVATQILATLAAFYGFFVAALPLWLVVLVWGWTFFWMQISELVKFLNAKLRAPKPAH